MSPIIANSPAMRPRRCNSIAAPVKRAAGQFVHQDAIRYLTRALELAEAGDLTTQYELHALRAHVHFVRADRAAQTQDLDAMMALAEAMDDAPKVSDVWLQRAALAEAQGAYAEAIDAVERATRIAGDDEKAHWDVAAAIQLGSIYWNQGDYLKADANYQRGLDLARAAGDRNAEATILLHLGALNAYYGPYDATKAIIQQALDAARDLGNEEGQVWASNQLGFLIVEQGDDDYEEAECALMDGLLLARKIGHRAYIAKLSSNLALLHDRRGRRAQGLACLNESLAIARETGSARHEAFAQNYRGGILLNEMKLDAAHTAYAQALSRFRAIGYRQGEGKTLSEMALLALMIGDHEQGHRHAADALEIAEQIGIQRDQAYALTRLGYALEGMANLAAAAEVYEQALAIYHATNQRSRGLEPAAGLARVAYAQDDHTEALAKVASIIAAVRQRALDATIEAEWVYLSCLQILRASDDSDHAALLARATRLHNARRVLLGENGDQISLKTHLHTFCNAFETPLVLE